MFDTSRAASPDFAIGAVKRAPRVAGDERGLIERAMPGLIHGVDIETIRLRLSGVKS